MNILSTEKDTQKGLIKRFDSCPDCGSTERMMGKLAEEMVAAGYISGDMDVGLEEIGGSVVDPTKMGTMLAKSVRPAMYALRDICIGCGRKITVKIVRKEVEVNINKVAAPR